MQKRHAAGLHAIFQLEEDDHTLKNSLYVHYFSDVFISSIGVSANPLKGAACALRPNQHHPTESCHHRSNQYIYCYCQYHRNSHSPQMMGVDYLYSDHQDGTYIFLCFITCCKCPNVLSWISMRDLWNCCWNCCCWNCCCC